MSKEDLQAARAAHQAARKRALACPCCGAALGLTAGDTQVPDDEPINILARQFMLQASYLHSLGQLYLRSVEDVAEDIASGHTILVDTSGGQGK